MSMLAPMMHCPHCKDRAYARTSKYLSDLLREVRYCCRNLDCGCIFVCTLEAVRIVSPSAIPDPEIKLPFSPHMRLELLAHQITQHQQQNTEGCTP